MIIVRTLKFGDLEQEIWSIWLNNERKNEKKRIKKSKTLEIHDDIVNILKVNIVVNGIFFLKIF